MRIKRKIMIAMSVLLIMVNGLTVAAEMSKESVTMEDINMNGEKNHIHIRRICLLSKR